MLRKTLLFSLTVFTIAAGLTIPQENPTQVRTATSLANRPNIILIVTDDQTDYEMQNMPKTQRLLAKTGTVVQDFISPHPVCCPARAELMTGEYAQNNGVRYNNGPYGGWRGFVNAGNHRSNIGTWLTAAGYSTGYIGKTLNGFNIKKSTMRGFNYWNPSIRNTYSYTDTTFYNNGDPEYHKEYVTDVVANYATDFISNQNPDRPFFLWVSHVGPHGSSDGERSWTPPKVAPRHRGLFKGLTAPSQLKVSFNEQDLADKPSYVQEKFGETSRLNAIDKLYVRRLRALQAIDEANAQIVRALKKTGELDNTIIIYTSDNGFLLGEHRVVQKNLPYEEALQVPLIVKGPGVPRGKVLKNQTLTIVDIPTTILQAAGALKALRAVGKTDGVDMLPILRGEKQAPSIHLIQTGASVEDVGNQTWLFRGVRTNRYTYAYWFTGEKELYDRVQDPEQLNNIANDPQYASVVAKLHQATLRLQNCKGYKQCNTQADADLISVPLDLDLLPLPW